MADLRIRRGNQEFAAPDPATLLEWAKAGRVVATDEVFHPGKKEWVSVRTVAGMAGVFPAVRPTQPNDVACMSCGYVGPKMSYGCFRVGMVIVLALFMILPGILYALYVEHQVKQCPQCGNKTLVPVGSPKGQEIVARRA